MGLRPMLYHYESGEHVTGCGESECVSATMLIGTPAMWWLALPVLAWGCGERCSAPIGATPLCSWAISRGCCRGSSTSTDRCTTSTPRRWHRFWPWGLTLVLGQILGSARNGYERRGTGLLVLSLYVGLVVANFAWLWPVLNGEPITHDRWQAELWLPSWR